MYTLKNTPLYTDGRCVQAFFYSMHSCTEKIYEAAICRKLLKYNLGMFTECSASGRDSAIPF